jgi:hypothetical protein
MNRTDPHRATTAASTENLVNTLARAHDPAREHPQKVVS